MSKVTFIDEADIQNQTVLLRVDFNVSFNPDKTVADDLRIKQALPTINFLLEKNNKLILISHLGKPNGRDLQYSLLPVVARMKVYLPNYEIKLIREPFNEDKAVFQNQNPNQILLLENIRFYQEEKNNDTEFARKLASLAEIYVNDAFSVCHRTDTSIMTLPQLLPSYGGFLLKKEVEEIAKITENQKKPFVTILGGAKISTKIHLLRKLIQIADYLLIGGGIANTFLASIGHEVGQSIYQKEEVSFVKDLISSMPQKNTQLILPVDVVVDPGNKIKKVNEVAAEEKIVDIGPQTQEKFREIISFARTIIWNGPMGLFEDARFRKGTDSVFQAISENKGATSIIGGGDTTVAISKQKNLENITYISTGGGAMLQFIEKGTLPGIEALKR